MPDRRIKVSSNWSLLFKWHYACGWQRLWSVSYKFGRSSLLTFAYVKMLFFFVTSCDASGVLSLFRWEVSGSCSIFEWWQHSGCICPYVTTVDTWTWLQCYSVWVISVLWIEKYDDRVTRTYGKFLWFLLCLECLSVCVKASKNYKIFIIHFSVQFFHDFHYGKFVKLTGWHIIVLFGPAFPFQEESGFNLSCGAGYHTLKLFLFFFISSRRMLR